jgi:hypothetical protein
MNIELIIPLLVLAVIVVELSALNFGLPNPVLRLESVVVSELVIPDSGCCGCRDPLSPFIPTPPPSLFV